MDVALRACHQRRRRAVSNTVSQLISQSIAASYISANQQSQRLFCLGLRSVGSADEPSDLRQSDLVGICVALDVEDEGVFVGVMLDDVVVHVHQDPNAKDTRDELHVLDMRLHIGLKPESFSSLTLFYFSCTRWLSSLWPRRTSLISTVDRLKQFVNRCSAADEL